jgi:Peptidase S46
MNLDPRTAILAVCLLLLTLSPRVSGDEGMWLFNKPPIDQLKKAHDFTFPDGWLDHVQKSSVRFNSGGSGSFVSADGLVITNHHVGADALQKMGTEKKNYYRDGFYAKTREEEHKCEAMELNVLMEIHDVTDRVRAAVTSDLSSEKAALARRAVINEIESEYAKKTKLKPQVVTLYQGGAYHLYLFKKYTDVRLVFAPEQQIAFYGGDPDNFEYPRFDLDICIFRVYENGKPAVIKDYLKWGTKGIKKDDLLFVSGHPGRTSRLATLAELHYMRDTSFPFLMQRLNRWEVMLSSFSERSDENRRQAKEFFFGVQNSRKARIGGLQALLDPKLMIARQKEETRLKAAYADTRKGAGPSPWERIAAAQKVRAKHLRPYTLLEGGAGFNCELFNIARTLVRAADEKAKPNNQRLREFNESNHESLEEQLFSPESVYPEYEIVKLTDALIFLSSELHHSSEVVGKVLAHQSPVDRARALVTGTKLADVKERKRLYEGGKAAIDASTDPMILLARAVDPESREVRKIMESEVEEVSRQAYGEIAAIKFSLDGTKTYPDATFTLRLAFGIAKGYEEGGKHIPFTTHFEGLYDRAKEHDNKFPFDLPKRWVDAKEKLDLKTPFNFVCTADIIGGNSGSPVVNRDAEFVGIIFDGNIQSLMLDFAYSEIQARAVSVDAQAIMEALRKVYDAGPLADELAGKK